MDTSVIPKGLVTFSGNKEIVLLHIAGNVNSIEWVEI